MTYAFWHFGNLTCDMSVAVWRPLGGMVRRSYQHALSLGLQGNHGYPPFEGFSVEYPLLAQVSLEPNDGSERAEPCTESTSSGRTTGRMCREYCLRDACHTLDNDIAPGRTRIGRRNKVHQAQNSNSRRLAQASHLARLRQKNQCPVIHPAICPKRVALQSALMFRRSKALGPRATHSSVPRGLRPERSTP